MPRGAEVLANVKGQIIGLTLARKSIRQIENELAIPKSTIADIVKRFKETGSNENMPRSGHPSILTERDKNHLSIELKRQRFTSLTDISNHLPIKASQRVLREALNERGMKLYAAAKKPQISAKNVENRKKWCRKVSEWSEERWKKIIWSDESSVELGFSSRHTKVWRMKGERYEPYCLASNRRSGRISVMFWSCFWQNELGPLVALPKGRIDSIKYCEILEEHLFPFYTTVKEVLGEEPVFMDDNCRVHESKTTKDFKETLGIQTLDWPAQSPDMTPIENLWKHWKDRIQKANPPPTTREELIEVAQQSWEELKTTNIGQTLADSMKNRIAALKISKGAPTKY